MSSSGTPGILKGLKRGSALSLPYTVTPEPGESCRAVQKTSGDPGRSGINRVTSGTRGVRGSSQGSVREPEC
ncbi:hypothetical protein E2C01_031193 [Portunus trituberculatus]|uniref:Uncharacterized protein n=1 Tax=Portunus trituberculatus TaxID=210409 RepID=A0A5B7EZE9_PORTR|nr:hypothetical protein [Portunus trituberculatus]